MKKIEVVCDKNTKLSDFLFSQGLMASQVKKILKQKDVKIDGCRAENSNVVVSPGQRVVFYLAEDRIKEKNKKFDIVYQDEYIYVINKKAGIEVCGQNGIEGQLDDAIPVHRLDRDTSGLCILAKNRNAEEVLLKAFKEHKITKKYLCEVIGDTSFRGIIYSAYLLKNSKDSYVKIFDKEVKNSRQIFTRFKTVRHGNATSLVDVELLTGKTHQIRAHLAHLGHAILGDEKYGNKEINKKYKEKRQKLFCYYLKLNGIEGLSCLDNKEFVIYPDWYKEKGVL